MTTPRLNDLARLVEESRREDALLSGQVMSLAMHKPEGLRALARPARSTVRPTSGPLAIPRKRRPE